MQTILVVEDNELNMKLFCDVLESQDYRVLQAYSGLAALQIASEQTPDLILLDIQLPDMSGLEVARSIKANELLKKTRILAVTAFAMKGDAEAFLERGCDAYLSKPIELLTLITTIREMLSEEGENSQPRTIEKDRRGHDAAKGSSYKT